MSEWKAGGKAMVDLVQGPGDAHTFRIPANGGPYFLVSASALQDVPAADPHQALKDAVVEAAKVWREGRTVCDSRSPSAALLRTIDDLIDAQKPDPIEVFYAAAEPAVLCNPAFWEECRSKPDECHCRRHVAEGLAAVEAMRNAK